MSDEADQKSASGKEPGTMEKSATAGSLHLLSISEEDFSNLSLYEKKSTLINQEMDRMGFGKYQLCIFFLCGFGYFLDLMWSQSLALILTPVSQEFGVPDDKQADIYVAANVGLTVGALFWGLSVDIIGRKWAFNLTCLITSVLGTLIAAPPNSFDAVCAIVALSSFGLGGNIPIDATITLEFLPTKNRWLLAMLSMFQPLGVSICVILAYGLIPDYTCDTSLPACNTGETPCCNRSDNLGWRYLIIVLGAITLIIFFARALVFTFKESPKYLLSRGREQEAIDVLHYIAKFNKTTPPSLTLDTFRSLASPEESLTSDQEQNMLRSEPKRTLLQQTKHVLAGAIKRVSALKTLFFTKTMALTVICLWIAFIGAYWAFNLAGSFLPIILQRRGAEQDQSLRDTYRSYIAIYTPGIAGSFFAAAVMEIPRVGRKWSMFFFGALQAVSIGLYVKVTNYAGSIGLNAMEYIFQTAYVGLLYAYAPEVFPSPFRGTAVGAASTLGRIAGIVAPRAASPFFAAQSNGVLWLALGGNLVSIVALIGLPVETKGKQAI